MPEIGGYIEFEHYNGSMLHAGNGFLKLNSGRSCLAHLILSRNIKHITLPYFLCETVKETCEKYGVETVFYHINSDFDPDFNIDQEWKNTDSKSNFVYIVNYYGQLTEPKIHELSKAYNGKLIIDNAQAYFDKPVDNIDTIYTCRKFFGVSDGGILCTTSKSAHERYDRLEVDKSTDRMGFLLGRFEGKASDYYSKYISNNELFKTEPIKKMSKLTENLLRGINYDFVRDRRSDNYRILNNRLRSINELKLRKVSGAFAYPLLIPNGAEVKKRLIERKIYIPTLWPNVLEEVSKDSLEYRYAADLLPLPCDHRYGEKEMNYIADMVKDVISPNSP